jgi:hypothetical protein
MKVIEQNTVIEKTAVGGAFELADMLSWNDPHLQARGDDVVS